jgi:hypothetical protein
MLPRHDGCLVAGAEVESARLSPQAQEFVQESQRRRRKQVVASPIMLNPRAIKHAGDEIRNELLAVHLAQEVLGVVSFELVGFFVLVHGKGKLQDFRGQQQASCNQRQKQTQQKMLVPVSP